eukprot:6436370-Amphidinium_carterae.1
MTLCEEYAAMPLRNVAEGAQGRRDSGRHVRAQAGMNWSVGVSKPLDKGYCCRFRWVEEWIWQHIICLLENQF